MIIQLRVRPKIAPAATLRHRTLGVPRKPLPRVIQMQYVFTPETKRREPARHASLLFFFGPIRARHANDFIAENAPREVSSAVGTAYAGVDACCEHGIARLHGGRGHHGSCTVVVGERRAGIAVDAAEGDLARRGLQRGDSVALGALCGLDLELCSLEEEAVALEIGAVSVAPCSAADIVNVSRSADGHDQRGSLEVVELFDIACKYFHHGICDAGKADGLDISLFHSARDLFAEPCGELVVREVTERNIGSVCERQGGLISDDGPIPRSYQG